MLMHPAPLYVRCSLHRKYLIQKRRADESHCALRVRASGGAAIQIDRRNIRHWLTKLMRSGTVANPNSMQQMHILFEGG